MYTQSLLISVLVAISEARFGQEQVPIQAISDLSAFGKPGEAATLAGQSISFLLGAANPCGKLSQADKIVSTLGTDPEVIAAARGLAAAEQNFNPFTASIPSICSDVSLPATEELRGVVPLVDPAVIGSAGENANSATSLTTPFDATGLSVAEVMAAQGFSNFTTKAADGTARAAPIGGAASAAPASPATTPAPFVGKPVANASSVASACVPSTAFITVTMPAASANATKAAPVATGAPDAGAGGKNGVKNGGKNGGENGNENGAGAGASPAVGGGAGAVSDPKTGTFDGFVASSIAANDFGTCTPTIKFEAGLNGRKETESTFQATDPVVNKGQQEALNPNIITNRICVQLGNVCGASEAGKAACLAAKASILALGTRDKSTADAWNTALGFAGADTNPDDAPQAGLVGHT